MHAEKNFNEINCSLLWIVWYLYALNFSDINKPFGQKEPPLTDHIVNILGRYPDGGQILKV
jgi:hypothetical protein